MLVLLSAPPVCLAQILFQEDFEGGTSGQFLQDAPYSWNLAFSSGPTIARINHSNPIQDGLGINGNSHPTTGLGIYTKPIAAPVGDGFRLTADLYAHNFTVDNAIGVGDPGLSPNGVANYLSGVFLQAFPNGTSGAWNFHARGLGIVYPISFPSNPRDQMVLAEIEIDLTTHVATGSLTDANNHTESISVPFEPGATDRFSVLSLMQRNNPALSVDNIKLEKLVLDLEWNANGAGSWNTASNWTPANDPQATAIVPNSKGAIANFGPVITSPRSVYVLDPVTVRKLRFDSPHMYTIEGLNSVSFQARKRATAGIDVSTGNHRLIAPVELVSSTVATVPLGSTLTLNGPLNLNGNFLTKLDNGRMTINGSLPPATIPVGGAIVVQGGTLDGDGTVDGYLTNIASTVAPGDNGPGRLTVSGHYSQGANGRDPPVIQPSLAIDIDGLTPGSQHDVLDVVGNIDIFGGSLDISMGFTPNPGDTFDILNFASARGAFDSINGEPGQGMYWDTSQLFEDGTLTALEFTAGALVAEHVADNNPVTEGPIHWKKHGSFLGAPDNVGKPNWKMNLPVGSNFYRVVGSENAHDDCPAPNTTLEQAFNHANGWTATWEVQLVAGDVHQDAFMQIQDNQLLRISLYDGTNTTDGESLGAYLSFNNDVGTNVQLGSVDPTDGFHTYQIVLDAGGTPVCTNSADDTYRIFVDGVLQHTVSRSSISAIGDRTELIMGRFALGSDTTASETRNAVWRFESGQNPMTSMIVPEPATVAFLITTLCAGCLFGARRRLHRVTLEQISQNNRTGLQARDAKTRRIFTSFLVAGTVGFAWSSSIAHGLDLDRGHRVLLERGLQLQALGHPVENGFDLARWNESNFTSIDLQYAFYPTTAELSLGLQGVPWGRSMHGQEYKWNPDLFEHELPYLGDMIRFQIKDEQDLTNPVEIARTAAIMEDLHNKYPDLLLNTDVGQSVIEMRNYMQQAQPDLLMNQSYPFFGGAGTEGGSPTLLYENMATFREAALGGNDGTYTRPIPFGLFSQTFVRGGHTVSDSESRLNVFAAWTFGYKLVDAFFYDTVPAGVGTLETVLFSGVGTNNPTPLFYQLAETNRQSLNLGPALVRLLTTDARLIMGLHGGGIENTLPTDVVAWDPSADPYIDSISATNLGSKNGGQRGDVGVGYFKPLDPAFTDPGYEDDIYFMVLNGLSDPATSGTVSATSQSIRVNFDFANSGIHRLLRLNRNTGDVEPVNLISDGGSLYHIDLVLEGGTGDLFKFDNGGRFVSIASACDFNADDSCNLADINLMYAEGNLVAGVPTTMDSKRFDLVDDAEINGADITAWLAEAGFQNGYDSPYRRGDSDGLNSKSPETRDVDITDFNSLAGNFDPIGNNAAANLWHAGNFDGDDDIDITDFNSLAGNFAPTIYGGNQTIPEPTSIMLLLWAVVGTLNIFPLGASKREKIR